MFRTLALLTLALLPAVGQANAPLEKAKRAYRQGQPGVALTRLAEAEADLTVTESELVEVYWYQAASRYALGRQSEAGASFERLLALRPLYEPNREDTAPPLLAAFQVRAEEYRRTRGVQLGAPLLRGSQLEVRVWRDAGRVDNVTVFIRALGDSTFQQVVCPLHDGRARGTIDNVELLARSEEREMLEVVLEARDRHGTPLARAGDARHPLPLALVTPPAALVGPALPPLPARPPPPVPPPPESPPPLPAPVDGPQKPAAAPGWGASWRVALAGGSAALGGLAAAAGFAVGAGVLAGTSLAGLWLHPRTGGAQTSPTLVGWRGGGGGGGGGVVLGVVGAALLGPLVVTLLGLGAWGRYRVHPDPGPAGPGRPAGPPPLT